MAGKKDNSPNLVVVDADASAGQAVALTLGRAGLGVEVCPLEIPRVVQACRSLEPEVVLVHAELVDSAVLKLVKGLRAEGLGQVPIALLCEDVRDAVFVQPMRTGVVELLEAPFKAVHVSRLRLLAMELPERPGRIRGQGAKGELLALARHLLAVQRSGKLTVGEGTQQEGHARFVRGSPRGASFAGQSGGAAFMGMTRSGLVWTFVEDPDEEMLVLDSAAEGDEQVIVGELVDEAAPPDAPTAPPPTAPAVDPEAAQWPLLFVDDEESVLSMLAGYFSKRGYPVHSAANGAEALKVLGANPVEAVVADLAMPQLDGWGFLRVVREDFRTREIPVALYSAHDDFREALRVLNAGAQAYFPKSLRLASLDIQVRELLEPRRRFFRLLRAEGGMQIDIGALGPQWVLRSLARLGFDGQFDARDRWASWRGRFQAGRLAALSSTTGTVKLSGEQALGTFLSSLDSLGTLSRSKERVADEFAQEATPAVLDRAVTRLNEERWKSREDQVLKTRAVEVNPDVYALYVTVCPKAWLPIVRMLCEGRATPADAAARLNVTAREVSMVVKDLQRRGVATLKS